jgi:hypothetical protein
MSSVSAVRRRVHLPCRGSSVPRLGVCDAADALGGANRLGCRRTALGISAIGARAPRSSTHYRLCCSMRPHPAARSLRAVRWQTESASDSAARKVGLDLRTGVRKTNDPASLRASDRKQASPTARAISRSVRLSIGPPPPLRRADQSVGGRRNVSHWDALI